MSETYEKPLFSVHDYDYEGDETEDGIFLHFGNTRIKVAENELGYESFINHLKSMQNEIEETCKYR